MNVPFSIMDTIITIIQKYMTSIILYVFNCIFVA